MLNIMHVRTCITVCRSGALGKALRREPEQSSCWASGEASVRSGVTVGCSPAAFCLSGSSVVRKPPVLAVGRKDVALELLFF